MGKTLEDLRLSLEKAETEFHSAILHEIADAPDTCSSAIPIGKHLFTVKLSEIQASDGVLAPEYYDFQVQKQALLQACENARSPSILLPRILQTGKVKNNSHGTIRLHPVILAVVRKIVNEAKF